MKLNQVPDAVKQLIRTAERDFHKAERSGDILEPFIWMSHDVFGNRTMPVGRFMRPGFKGYIEALMVAAAKVGSSKIALVSEMWVVASKGDNTQFDMELAQKGLLHKHAQAKETLGIQYEDRTQMILGTAHINRVSKHAPRRLSAWTFMENDWNEAKEQVTEQFGEITTPRFQSSFAKADNPSDDIMERTLELVLAIMGRKHASR